MPTDSAAVSAAVSTAEARVLQAAREYASAVLGVASLDLSISRAAGIMHGAAIDLVVIEAAEAKRRAAEARDDGEVQP